MLGAAAVGLGIAALASWMGVSSELASVLGIALVGLLVLALVTAFLRRRQGGAVPAHAHFNRSTTDRSRFEPTMPAPESVFAPQPTVSPALAPQLSPELASKWPPGFDAPAFIAQAREQFVRLQAAFDHADLATLREVASTEVFDELRRQIDERHGATNVTEVMRLDTDLVEVQTDVDEYTATIRFHGLVREAPGTEPVQFNELWHLAKPRDGSAGWLLVGIQNPG
jgi:predicted lipid-binding transport protein (Tim44 family)